MIRDFQRLKDGPFDLLVIGGGVLGAWTAYDGALRGLKTAIIDRGDWAGETSSASSKLIHGGLRYLEQLWMGLVYETLKERERLIHLAPHRVFQLPFIVPVYRDARLGRLTLKAGLTLYDILAAFNSKVKFPFHRYLSREELLKEAPYLRRENLSGGFLYTDARTDDARFTLEIVDGASSAGVAAVNYAEAEELTLSQNRVLGAVVKDRETGELAEVTASVTVNAAGPWAFKLGKTAGELLPPYSLTKGVHLIMPRISEKNALLVSTRSDNRILFMLPWYGATLLGTTDTDFRGDPDQMELDQADIDYLLRAGNSYLETTSWNESHIRGHFTGLRVLQKKNDQSPSDRTREWALVEPAPNFLMSLGGKFTSARLEAERINDRVVGILGGQRSEKRPTENRPFPWAPSETGWEKEFTDEGIRGGLDPETARECAFRYGKLLPGLLKIVSASDELKERISPSHPFCQGEIIYAVKYEMARNLKDIFFRRIPLGKITRMEKESVERGARIAAEVSGWDKERVEYEVASILEEDPF